MKKILNSILFPIFFCVAICLCIIIYKESCYSIDEFNIKVVLFTSLSTILLAAIMAVLTYEIGSNQEKVQRDAIKMQLFDKRYKIFKSIANSYAVATEKDYSNFILSGNCNNPLSINKKIYDTREQMCDAVMLSEALFDNELTSKIRDASRRYKVIYDMHFTLFKQNSPLSNDEKFTILVKDQLFATRSKDIQQNNKELKEKYPDYYHGNKMFETEAAHYSDWLTSSGILTDFDKYLKIHDLDKR